MWRQGFSLSGSCMVYGHAIGFDLDLKEKDQKQLNSNQNGSISKTKLFGVNFMQIGP